MDPASIISTLTLENAILELTPVFQFVVGMVLYSVFVYKFYRFLADKEIFEFNYDKYSPNWSGKAQKAALFVIHCLAYIFLFPLFTIFWFVAIVVLLALLSKIPEGQSPSMTIQNIMLVSISLVTAIRVTSYYTEDLSKDLSKMLPFALLGVFLVDATYFSLSNSLSVLEAGLTHLDKVIYYCLFLVGLETVLRVTDSIKNRLFPKKKDPEKHEDPEDQGEE